MATLNGTLHSVCTLKSDAVSDLQLAEILFEVSGTYAQADNAQLQAIPTLIQDSRRNGKTVTLVDAMRGTHATKSSNPAVIMSLTTVAVSTNDVTFAITDTDESTELADGAVPAQDRPFSVVVAFTEA